jgi:hypothetical protein
VVDAGGNPASIPAVVETILRIECDGTGIPTVDDVVVIDHHRSGDPGFGGEPRHFFTASSVGQLIEWMCERGIRPFEGDLGWNWGNPRKAYFARRVQFVFSRWLAHSAADNGLSSVGSIPSAIVCAAAADHCLAAAYRGECPGVDPDELMAWRVSSRAEFQKINPDELMTTIRTTMARVYTLSDEQFSYIVDLTGEPGGTLPEAPEAAARLGLAIIARVKDRDGREKDVLMGSATPPHIAEWMAARRAEGREVYGDPARGFAGAYL